MKRPILALTLIALISLENDAQSPDPNAPIWGLFASGVGEKLSPCMDPCWVTYTVGLTTDESIIANLEYGTMATIISNVNWQEATAQQRRFGRYFDDEPDGTWKCIPCDVSLNNGIWSGWGTMTITGNGTTIGGSYSDTYERSSPGKIKIYRDEKGKWIGTWEESSIGRKGILYEIVISPDGNRISGKYDTTVDGGKGNWHKGARFTWNYKSPNVKD